MILNLNLTLKDEIKNKLEVNTDNINIKIEQLKSKKGYIKNIYEIEITDEIKDFCWDFSSKIILGKNQYDRLHPYWINDTELQNLIRIQRSYVGKIGEVAFLILLASKGINAVSDDMFKIYEGQQNTDRYDFQTYDEESIDIKTAFRPIHKKLVVNLSQLNNIPKDFYVGIKLNAEDSELNNKIIIDKSITKATIYGYAEFQYLKNRNTENLKEGDCKSIELKYLMNIDMLINKFKI